ncbi:ionotropic receptor 75a isoform X2 [Drosophila santomea]|uniref:ionotropic receptor 75a isoform X2 n=1 Tax=Drosophila santomea TaxID=129105 RepID=UPI0019532028|nr:ionotropic receptor 75a isoform X2 [Drosophila santomea]
MTSSWPLYRLIVFNLLEINLSNLMVFHCWSIEEAFPLVEMLNQNGIYSQYINLQNPENLANVHKKYLDSDLVRMGVFLDLGCDQAELVTNQSSRGRLYNQNLHWLLYDEAGNFTKLRQLFGGANLSLNADLTYVSRQDEELFMLHDVYNKGSHLGGKLNITVDQTLHCNRSHCQVKDYLSELHLRPRLQHRMDLSSVTFRLAALVSVLPINSSEEELLEFLNSDRDSHMDSISRIGNRLIMHTQEILGFKLHYIWCGTWSVQDAFGGAIGMLTNESAELSTSPFVPSWNRLHYVHPMTEQAQFRAVCMFRTPHNAGIKAAVFLEPFMPSVWFAFAGLLIFAGVLLWMIFHLERHWMQRCLDFIPSLLSSCLISFGAACIQGSYLMPRSAGGRLAFIAVMLTSFLMYNYYTSIVVSTLLGSPVRSNIRTIQQLADSSLDVGFDTVPFTKTYLVSSARPDIRSLYKQKVESKRDPNSVWLSPEEGVIRVRDQPGFVYTSEASFMYHFVEKHYLPREISDLNEIILRPESAVYGMVHLNSTYRQLLTQLQVRMLETGITSKQSRFFSKTKLDTFSNSFVIQVGMEYAAPLFISLLVAYFLALVILILEIFWARYSKKKLITVIPQNQ